MSGTADNTTRQAGYAVANAMLRPTPDAVAQAMDALDEAVKRWMDATGSRAGLTAALAYVEARKALIAAVRAECAADTERLDWMQERYVAADFEYTIDEKPATALIIHAPRSARVGPNLRATIDAALEAHP